MPITEEFNSFDIDPDMMTIVIEEGISVLISIDFVRQLFLQKDCGDFSFSPKNFATDVTIRSKKLSFMGYRL